MPRETIIVFLWIVIVAIIHISFNTVFGGIVFPTFDQMANETDFVNQTRYEERSDMLKSTFDYIFVIFYIVPFLYLVVKKLLKHEPEAVPMMNYGGY
jgi:hypothetical protein